jgi:NAD(P)-dependent dehydrogenase (short-subunit alcohol dehydrogenase family)
MATVLVTGASRGLGLEFARQYAGSGWEVIACARKPADASELDSLKRRWGGTVTVEALDVTSEHQIESLAGKYSTVPIDLLINNAGDLGPRGAAREELHKQFFGSLDYTAWAKLLAVNLFGPMRIAEAFADNVERSEHKKMIFVSSTVGSIAEAKQPIFLYGSSKAALNKCVSLAANVLRPRGVIAAAVCPGHAKTALGGHGASVEVADSISGLRKVIAKLTLAESGSFTRYNGETIPW